ncbi:hypothetical protein F4560_007163 [Saccharothrix ecbatanensis]|uniref:Uncharacterized protein n=1 Tax=Saccharothrix ecbatanensis TaxID=1105145 RepID=A0A7W9HSE3_9PSEU|nr:hypothetical protein [Saccharothrix ecbatanensis]MBB5807395.1 hypothetical protein [Saccharothrix ecbatanensis]
MAEPLIKVTSPKREWLLRCYSDREDVFTVEVQDGGIDLFLPAGSDGIRLEAAQIAAFREALEEAVAQAEADLRAGARA